MPPLPQPAWLDWFGEIPAALAQRIACDASVWRIVLDPATGLPLDVGRAHRLVPHWIRRALHARDRGCRWPGCEAPTDWCDAHHHDKPWYLGGETNVDELMLLCRWHHVRVHEGGWRIELDRTTGEVTVLPTRRATLRTRPLPTLDRPRQTARRPRPFPTPHPKAA